MSVEACGVGREGDWSASCRWGSGVLEEFGGKQTGMDIGQRRRQRWEQPRCEVVESPVTVQMKVWRSFEYWWVLAGVAADGPAVLW